MPTPIIEVKNIGKKYNISHRQGGFVTLRDVLMNVLKSPLKFLIKKTKKMAGIGTKEEFWALKDINFTINQGEIVGIIGHNGAGKSTLLKILSQITPPTEGEIILNGRVGSLLEVGTGFHPELTGRENIFLNGAILGMSRKEIGEKFDKIVEFSGVEKFLDTPVKYYSSGMYVRLAFSVAAHLEPDILIVDEVLAVGDTEFQKKCLGKMDEITQKDGRTVLFVSHDIETIRSLCKRVIIIQSGKIFFSGDTDKALEIYSSSGIKEQIREDSAKKIYTSSFQCLQQKESGSFSFIAQAIANSPVGNVQVALGINDKFNKRITTLYSKWYNQSFPTNLGENIFSCDVENLFLRPDVYNVDILIDNGYETFDHFQNVFQFEVKNYDFLPNGYIPVEAHGPIITKQKWNKK
jgi:lipopolysaccharide transport system ATP-binding protein